MVTVRHIPEQPGIGRLGRHIEHDPRSRSFGVVRRDVPLRSVLWHRNAPIFDQGNTGSCTGNALAGALSTRPFRHRFGEPTARKLYHRATQLDGIPGEWPPDDTGSSGLAVCKAAKERGWISAYRHCFGLDDVLHALQAGPAIAGVTWLTGCDVPDSNGLIRYDGDVRGGHEFELLGVDVDARTIRAVNSWGPSWGDRGYFVWTFDDFAKALADQGDVTVPEP